MTCICHSRKNLLESGNMLVILHSCQSYSLHAFAMLRLVSLLMLVNLCSLYWQRMRKGKGKCRREYVASFTTLNKSHPLHTGRCWSTDSFNFVPISSRGHGFLYLVDNWEIVTIMVPPSPAQMQPQRDEDPRHAVARTPFTGQLGWFFQPDPTPTRTSLDVYKWQPFLEHHINISPDRLFI